MNRRQFLAATAGTAALLSRPARAAAKPNLVILLADDLGWNAVGYHNPDIKTPHLDALVKQGIELDRFYVSPMCSPTRAGLMTGRYPIRFGCARSVFPPWRDYGVPTDEVMLPAALAQAGYTRRGVFGKWHLGHMRKRWYPLNRGFTDFHGCLNGAIDYFTHVREGELDWHDNWESSHDEGYSTDLIAEKAARFIKSAASMGDPFLCYVPFNAPHAPMQAPDSYMEMYPDLKLEIKRTLFAMVTALDDGIGRVLAAIDDAGIAENTVVWFFSDNGGVGNIPKNNEPLHGSKLTTFEGGVRTVSCVRYPGVYPAGTKLSEPCAFIDIMPTFLALAGVDANAAGCHPLDGVNLHPLLSGQTHTPPERDLYFYHGQSGADDEPCAVISGNWKLVLGGPDIREGITDKNTRLLYDIKNDPNETADLAASHPEIVTRLTKLMVDFREFQPANAVLPYNEGKEGFIAPKEWRPELD